MRRSLLPLCLVLLSLFPGCVTVISTTKGNAIDADRVADVRPGETTVTELLATLGSPIEVHRFTDGDVLIYRYRARRAFRLGLDPSRAASLVDVTQVAAEVGKNLKLTLEWINAREDRVVVILDEDGVVQAIGNQFPTDDLPWF